MKIFGLKKRAIFLTIFILYAFYTLVIKENGHEVLPTTTNLKKVFSNIPRIKTTKIKNDPVTQDKESLKALFANSNTEQFIRNKYLIDELLVPGSIDSQLSPKLLVILIQVHSRLIYLKELIYSLKNVRHIEKALVIFSHDIYDDEINEIVKSIKFCATLQIFYPYSLQVYKNEFPGQSAGDCHAKGIFKKTKVDPNRLKCNEENFADTFRNYRNYLVVQIKHHWIWKLGFVFEKVEVLKRVDFEVLLLEEDYFLMPDSIHLLHILSEKMTSEFDLVSLGAWDTRPKLNQVLSFKGANTYKKSKWYSINHNTGMVVRSAHWQMIKNCLNIFCDFDEYNWDWTFYYLSDKCFRKPIQSISPHQASRIIHIGKCGSHHKDKNCDPKLRVNELNSIYHSNKQNFFPNNMTELVDNKKYVYKYNRNGGWSDPRDHQLCKNILSNNINLTNIQIPNFTNGSHS